MFRHNNNSPTNAPVIPTTKEESLSGRFEGERDGDPSSSAQADSLGMTNKTSTVEASKPEPSLKELIEKNLKWSQIIYEQNRKINNKLLWSAIANWLRIFLIVVPLVLAILYLGPMLKGVISQYGSLFGDDSAKTGGANQNYLDSVLKFINSDPAKQEQLKALLK